MKKPHETALQRAAHDTRPVTAAQLRSALTPAAERFNVITDKQPKTHNLPPCSDNVQQRFAL